MEKVFCELCEGQHCPFMACEFWRWVRTIKSLCGFSVVGERMTFALCCQCCLQCFLSKIVADSKVCGDHHSWRVFTRKLWLMCGLLFVD